MSIHIPYILSHVSKKISHNFFITKNNNHWPTLMIPLDTNKLFVKMLDDIQDKGKQYCLPSSVVEFVLSHQIASLMRGGANADPS